jgi:hypothetical protein
MPHEWCWGIRHGVYHRSRSIQTPDQAISTSRGNRPFESAAWRIAYSGRVDAAPAAAIKELRPLAEAGISPGEALRRLGMVPSDYIDWEIAILEVADAWSAMNQAKR